MNCIDDKRDKGNWLDEKAQALSILKRVPKLILVQVPAPKVWKQTADTINFLLLFNFNNNFSPGMMCFT